jgi:hypothetical protein
MGQKAGHMVVLLIIYDSYSVSMKRPVIVIYLSSRHVLYRLFQQEQRRSVYGGVYRSASNRKANATCKANVGFAQRVCLTSWRARGAVSYKCLDESQVTLLAAAAAQALVLKSRSFYEP